MDRIETGRLGFYTGSRSGLTKVEAMGRGRYVVDSQIILAFLVQKWCPPSCTVGEVVHTARPLITNAGELSRGMAADLHRVSGPHIRAANNSVHQQLVLVRIEGVTA